MTDALSSTRDAAQPRPARRTVHRVLAAALLGLLVLPVLLRPAEFFRDDSYFYLQIAHHIVQGDGSTFHGITPTNGYHPLWMALVTAPVALASGNRSAALHLVVALQSLIALGAALLILRLARNMGLRYGIVGCVVLLGYLFGTGVFGSEAHLNALALVGALLALWKALDDDRALTWFLTGLLFGLAILARLDNVFFAVTLCALAVLHRAGPGLGLAIRRAAAGGLGGLLVLGPYLACNAVEYGHLTPISGAIKSTFPALAAEPGRLGPVGTLAVPFGCIALVIGAWPGVESRARVLWLGLGGGVLAHAIYIVGFTDHYTFWPWYYVGGFVAAGLAGAWLPERLAARAGPVFRMFVTSCVYVLALALLLAGAGRAWLKAFAPFSAGPLTIGVQINDYHWPEEFARWMKGNLPPDSRVFAFDWPGALAWYSERTILPMDGLVNDFRYNDQLLALGVEEYLCAHDVQYYFGLNESEGPVEHVSVTAPLYRKAAGVLSLHEDDRVVRVRDVVREPERTLPFALWRLHCPAATGRGGS
jgi:hypothetical protein